MLRAAKLGVEPLKTLKLKLWTLDIELQDLVFALLGFGLALAQYFLLGFDLALVQHFLTVPDILHF